MKYLLLLLVSCSLFILTSCDTERCSCHTFGAVQKAKEGKNISASIEKPEASKHQ